MGMGVKVRVWGDFALYSRPELKVERYSYDVMTPSAAREEFWKCWLGSLCRISSYRTSGKSFIVIRFN